MHIATNQQFISANYDSIVTLAAIVHHPPRAHPPTHPPPSAVTNDWKRSGAEYHISHLYIIHDQNENMCMHFVNIKSIAVLRLYCTHL